MISRDALIEEFISLCGPQTGDGWDNMGVRELIMRQKTVDAEPIIRCGNCRMRSDGGYCPDLELFVGENFFCAAGRK